MDQKKWDLRFLELAKLVSGWSRDPSSKVGAVIAQEKIVIALGFNGFAQKVDDRPEDYNNREIKLAKVVHAEMNAILFSDRDKLINATLYTWPFQPCARCASAIIQSGIIRVVSLDNKIERWAKEFELAEQQFREASVEITLYNKEILNGNEVDK